MHHALYALGNSPKPTNNQDQVTISCHPSMTNPKKLSKTQLAKMNATSIGRVQTCNNLIM